MQQNQGFSPSESPAQPVSTIDALQFVHFLASMGPNVATSALAGQLSHIPLLQGPEIPFYSLAQHRVIVSAVCPEDVRKEALFLDVAPAIFNYVMKLTKTNGGADFTRIETHFESIIATMFGLDLSKPAKRRIKKYELDVLELEHRALVLQQPNELVDLMLQKKLTGFNLPWTPCSWDSATAKKAFLIRFFELFK